MLLILWTKVESVNLLLDNVELPIIRSIKDSTVNHESNVTEERGNHCLGEIQLFQEH